MTKKRSLTGAAKTEDITVSCKPAPEVEDVIEAVEIKVEANVPKSRGSDLQVVLDEVCKFEGVNGYILKDATTAIINLDPALVVEYALLASQTFDCYSELESLFSLGDFKSAIVEFGRLKVLCMLIDKNTASIFMAKNADHARIHSALYRFE